MSYRINTLKTFEQTKREIADEMRLWGITKWEAVRVNNGARVTYVLRDKSIDLSMIKQETPASNLRVLFYAIHAMRMNEVRGMAEVFEAAYVQLAAPKQKRNPYDVLMILPDSPIEVAEAVFRSLAKKHHPDTGGSVDTFKELNEAIEEIRREHNGK